MEPVSIAAATLLTQIDWTKVIKEIAADESKKAAKSLLARCQPSDREKAARESVRIFAEAFLSELEDKTPLTAAIPGYHDQLRRLIEQAAPDITEWLQPETKAVDLSPVSRMWQGMNLDPLPEEFSWTFVSESYARGIRKQVKSDPNLLQQLIAAESEKQTRALQLIAPIDPGFDLSGYREYLRKKCSLLELSAVDVSAFGLQVKLWGIFVPQSARESAPVPDFPRELLRRFREEGLIAKEREDDETKRLREAYQNSPISPVLEILKRNRLVVVLGDPGSGKTSLLKFLVMKWVTEELTPLPVWIDLKGYAQDRRGFLKYCESASASYGLDARELEKKLGEGGAAVYLDGLDEIFHIPTRGLVIDEIIAFVSRYSQTPVYVTSRIVGYEQDKLRNAEFIHATLEDFDDSQVSKFLEKWHDDADSEAGNRGRALDRLERALRESRAVRALAGNPLLLTMMAILNRNQELPRDRVALYQQASRLLLNEWDATRSISVDDFAIYHKEELLRELAGAMQQGEGGLAGNLIEGPRLIEIFRTFLRALDIPDPYGKATSVVKQLEERNFIICLAGAGRFQFVHRTFLEYFCAAWFVDRFQKKQTLSMDQLKSEVFGAHWRDQTWHEVLRLITGLVGEKQAEELILFLVEQDGTYDNLANLILAAGCLSEVRNRQSIRITDLALCRMFMREVIRYDPQWAFPLSSSQTNLTRDRAFGLIALVWRSDSTRTWLSSTAQSDFDYTVRMAAAKELARGWRDHPETLPLLKDRAYDEQAAVRAAALEELATRWKNHSDVFLILKERARFDNDHQPASMALRELARGWKDDSETLSIIKSRARSDASSATALQQLARGWKDDPETLQIIKDCARSDRAVAIWALKELAHGWKYHPETLPFLRDLVQSDDKNAGTALAELVSGWKDVPQTLHLLKECVASGGDIVRATAIRELARGWKSDPDILSALKTLVCSDGTPWARAAAAQELALGWKDDPETHPILKELARSDKEGQVRLRAVQELARAWKDDPGTLPFLAERVRSDEYSTIRFSVIRELARSWKDDPRTLPILKERARYDRDHSARRAAREELILGWKADPEVIRLLHLLPQD